MFSELVDKIVAETHRGDKRHSIACSLNDVIQRIHSKRNYDRDNSEARAELLMADCKLVWPRPKNFRKMRNVFVNGNPKRRPEFINPNELVGRIDWDYYYYTDESFVFCAEGIKFVNLMYLRKPPNFEYFPEGQRPAVYDAQANMGEGKWTYLTPDKNAYAEFLGKPDLEAQARFRVTDWLLEEYNHVLFWGAINQLYSLTDDEQLKRNSYALFESGISDIYRDNTCSALE